MENQPSTVAVGAEPDSRVIPWESLERRVPATFTLAGMSLLASALVPVGLRTVTDWAWVSGLVLAGVAVIAVASGLFGLYPAVSEPTPRLATVGILGATLAGAAALGLIAMGALALVGEGIFGMDLGKPIGIFLVVALSMAGGFSAGFLSLGTAALRIDVLPRFTGQLLLLGGVALLVPIAREILQRGFGIETGIPPWLFLPALGLVTVDTLALGYYLRRRSWE